MEPGSLTHLGRRHVAAVALGERRDDGAGDAHRPGPGERLRVSAARQHDDRPGVGDVEDDPPVRVPRQEHEPPVARIAQQRRTWDPDPVEVEDDLGAGMDLRHRRGPRRGDEVGMRAGHHPPTALVGKEDLAGGDRSAPARRRSEPGARLAAIIPVARRHLDEAWIANPLGEETARPHLAAGRPHDAIARVQRDPDPRLLEDEPPCGDEGETVHRAHRS